MCVWCVCVLVCVGLEECVGVDECGGVEWGGPHPIPPPLGLVFENSREKRMYF